MNATQNKKLRERIKTECLRLWKERLDEKYGCYLVYSSEPPDKLNVSSGFTDLDIDSFIEKCSSLLLSLECTENQVIGAISLVLNQLPQRTWRIEQTDSQLQQLYGGEGMENAVGYEVNWIEHTAPDVALLDSRIDVIRPLLTRYIEKETTQ